MKTILSSIIVLMNASLYFILTAINLRRLSMGLIQRFLIVKYFVSEMMLSAMLKVSW